MQCHRLKELDGGNILIDCMLLTDELTRHYRVGLRSQRHFLSVIVRFVKDDDRVITKASERHHKIENTTANVPGIQQFYLHRHRIGDFP